MKAAAGDSTPRVSRTRWAAAGAALAVAVGGGTLAFVNAADDAPSNSFVPISPCRLLDTRAAFNVGPRNTPIGAAESLEVDVWGSNGECVIPSTATAIVINVTATNPTANSFMTVYPADVSLPTASNLNFVANQSSTPNLVTVSLSATGAIKVFNKNGTVNVIGDIAGYYQPNTGTANAGAACSVGGLSGVIVNGFDHEHNLSSKCFTSLVRTLAGNGNAGSTDGIGLYGSFNNPVAIALDPAGNMYIADQNSHKVRKVTVTGVVMTAAGSVQGFNPGPVASAQFNFPSGVAVDSKGNVYVADHFNHRIRKISEGSVTVLAGSGASLHGDGNGGSAHFSFPSGLAVDSDDNIYVADSGNNRIRKITPAGDVTTIAGSTSGFTDDTGSAAQFAWPNGLAIDADGNLYVADRDNHAIRKVTPAGEVSTLAGTGVLGFADGAGASAQFDTPSSVAVDSSGNVYVTDTNNHLIRKVTATGLTTTFAGALGVNDAVDGVGGAARFSFPTGIAIDLAGTIYVTDSTGWLRRIT